MARTTPVSVTGAVNMSECMAHLGESLPPTAIVTNGAGNFAAWLHRFHRHRAMHTQLAPTSGAMGYGYPAAIAAKSVHPDRDVICIAGDGDYLMGVSALWTAANARIPLLIIVANNRSFFNDELHQERVARDRSRPIENRWIGQRIDDPAPDLAGLARAQGLTGFGPVSEPAELVGVLRNAVEIVRAGGSVVVDVHVTPGYSPAMSSGMTRSHDD